ncbi:hypothetical protein OKA06_01075 [Novosphingobium sp. MW5]|nr:hypothetical protein [Novosphingobium sp. MW5]
MKSCRNNCGGFIGKQLCAMIKFSAIAMSAGGVEFRTEKDKAEKAQAPAVFSCSSGPLGEGVSLGMTTCWISFPFSDSAQIPIVTTRSASLGM